LNLHDVTLFSLAGDGEMCKDLAAMDWDMLEERFVALRQARVLVADYDLLRRDFAELHVRKKVSDYEIHCLIDYIFFFLSSFDRFYSSTHYLGSDSS
jgi:hypothetical protein